MAEMTQSIRLRKPVSPNVSNQLREGTCYAHVAARILLRYFKVYVIPKNIPGNNETAILKENSPCDDLYLNPYIFCRSRARGECEANQMDLLSMCGGNEYEHLCLILYMFFYTLIVTKIACSKQIAGGFLTAALNHVVDIIYDYNNITNIHLFCFMSRPDCEKIKVMLDKNYTMNDMKINYNYTSQNSEDIIILCQKYTSVQLYAGITIDADVCRFKENNPEVRVPTEIITSRAKPHIVTVIDYHDDFLFVKNSWGKEHASRGILRFHKSELEQLQNCYVGGVEMEQYPEPTMYSLCIRNRILELNGLIVNLSEYKRLNNPEYEDYFDENHSFIVETFVFIINVGKNDIFKELLDLFGIFDMKYGVNLFTYLVMYSLTSLVEPDNIVNLLNIMFNYYANHDKELPENTHLYLEHLKSQYAAMKKPQYIPVLHTFDPALHVFATPVLHMIETLKIWNENQSLNYIDLVDFNTLSRLLNSYNKYFNKNISFEEFENILGMYGAGEMLSYQKFIEIWQLEERRLGRIGKGYKKQINRTKKYKTKTNKKIQNQKNKSKNKSKKSH